MPGASYRSSGKIRVASRWCTTVPVAPLAAGKKELPLFRPLCPAFSFADVDTYGIDELDRFDVSKMILKQNKQP